MFRKQPNVSPLELRKQLLIAESEINRTQLLQEWQMLSGELYSMADRARSYNMIASAVLPLVAGIAAFTASKNAPVARAAAPALKASWLQKTIEGVRLASSVWQLFRSRESTPEQK